MTAVQLRLRDHQVVVCEPREAFARNRFIGVYKDVAHLLAALGMPEDMTYDFTHYRGKRGMMLADIQTLLHAVALKLGVIIYTGAVVGNLTAETLRRGELELVRSTGSGHEGLPTVGMTRWQYDSVARVRSGVDIRFDTVVEASGGRSGLRELLVGPENVVALRVIARSAAARDQSLDSFFDDPDDHCAEFVESDYGCPPGLRTAYARALLDQFDELPGELPCFVSNIDAAVLTAPVRATDRPVGLAAEIGEAALDVPPDWVVVQCPLPDWRLTRYQIEGPLPQDFPFAGSRVRTRAAWTGSTAERLVPVRGGGRSRLCRGEQVRRGPRAGSGGPPGRGSAPRTGDAGPQRSGSLPPLRGGAARRSGCGGERAHRVPHRSATRAGRSRGEAA
jgi:hypothetical protein